MKIICEGKVIGEITNRPVAMGSIVRYGSVNYNVIRSTAKGLEVVKRPGAFGQVATPDYNFDENEGPTYPHQFLVCDSGGDDFIGEVTLDAAPVQGQKIKIADKEYTIVDWSIGQRMRDEIYVK